jgi:hypothetical protein
MANNTILFIKMFYSDPKIMGPTPYERYCPKLLTELGITIFACAD